MNHTEFFIEKLNKSLLYRLSIGNHTVVSFNIPEIFKNYIRQYNLYITVILHDYTIISVQNCQDGKKRDLSWRFIFTIFRQGSVIVYQDKS